MILKKFDSVIGYFFCGRKCLKKAIIQIEGVTLNSSRQYHLEYLLSITEIGSVYVILVKILECPIIDILPFPFCYGKIMI